MAKQKKPIQEKISVLNKVTSKSVLKCTGKNWDQWIRLLSEAGAQNLTHKEIVSVLTKKYKLIPWWQQLVTSSYEVYIGRKIEGRNAKGEYATVATKTMPVSQKKLWKFLNSPAGQMVWLKPLSTLEMQLKEQFEIIGGVFGEIRTMHAPKRIRLSWQDSDWVKPTIVQINCIPRPKDKSVLAIQHEQLKDLRLKKQMLEHWKQVLNEIAEILINYPT